MLRLIIGHPPLQTVLFLGYHQLLCRFETGALRLVLLPPPLNFLVLHMHESTLQTLAVDSVTQLYSRL